MIRHISALAAAIVLSLSSVACVSSPESESENQSEAAETSHDVSRSAYFETFTGVDGKNYFGFHAGNGESLLRSEGYNTLDAAQDGIGALLENGINAHRYEVNKADDGQWYFNVKAANGEILGTSESYSTKAHADRGARAVQGLVREARKALRIQAGPTQ